MIIYKCHTPVDEESHKRFETTSPSCSVLGTLLSNQTGTLTTSHISIGTQNYG